MWLFEFKVVELVPQGRALQQLKERGEPIFMIGVEFSRVNRNIVEFEVELI